MTYEFLQEHIARAMGSDFFAGGAALGMLGASIAIARMIWGRIAGLIARRIWVRVSVDNRSAAYRHMLEWLDHSGVLSHSRRLRVTATAHGIERLGPDFGSYWFWWQGRLGRLHRDDGHQGPRVREPWQPAADGDDHGAPAVRQRRYGRGLAGRGQGPHRGTPADRSRNFRPARRVLGEHRRGATAATAASVLCDDDRIDRLIGDVRRFLEAREWYTERGVPWRRGYLLYGPPGTGKTSAIRAIASEVGVDIAMLDIGRAGLTDDQLREAMMIAPRGALIAIEDVDAAFVEREKGEKALGVSFSGLLNAIDGVASQEGRALVMTTNHRERLDPALIRPGRADVHVELGPVGAATAARLFVRFFPEEPELAERFRTALGAARVTPAALQGWLLANVEDPDRAATAEGLAPALAIAAE